MSNDYAPICLFTYNRLEETKKTIFALQNNVLATESNLFIFSDGAKDDYSSKEVKEVREFLKKVKGFKSISIFESENNKGLASSIISGVSRIVKNYGRVIVLEDDIVTSSNFLIYMNTALSHYEVNNDVFQVSGFMFPINSKSLPDTFFYQANTCWGWATWNRAWKHYENDSNKLISLLTQKDISWKDFNSMQGKEFQKQLYNNSKGKLNTWAVKWHAVIKLNNAKVLHPKESFVLNIGFSGSGENCSKGDFLGNINDNLLLNISDAENYLNELALTRLKIYFKKRYSFLEKLKRKIISYF